MAVCQCNLPLTYSYNNSNILEIINVSMKNDSSSPTICIIFIFLKNDVSRCIDEYNPLIYT